MNRYTIVAEFTTETKNGISTIKRLDREFDHEIPLTATFLRKLLDDINYELIADSYDRDTGVVDMNGISIQVWKQEFEPSTQSFETESCCQEDCGCKDFSTNNSENFPSSKELTQALDEVLDEMADDKEEYLK